MSRRLLCRIRGRAVTITEYDSGVGVIVLVAAMKTTRRPGGTRHHELLLPAPSSADGLGRLLTAMAHTVRLERLRAERELTAVAAKGGWL